MRKILITLVSILFIVSCASSNDTTTQILTESQYFASIGEYEKAIDEIDKDNSNDHKLLFNKAVYLSELERYEESNNLLDYLIQNDAERIQYLKLKAFNIGYGGVFEDFIKVIDRLYEIKPLDSKISDIYIEKHMQLKDYDKVRDAVNLLLDAEINVSQNQRRFLEIEKALKTSAYPYYTTLIKP